MTDKYWDQLMLKNGDVVRFIPTQPDDNHVGGITKDERQSIMQLKSDFASVSNRAETLEDASEGRLYTSTATSGSGTQTVPDGSMCRAIVKEWDGKTVVQDGQLVSADVSAVKSYDDDDAVIDTHTIPSSVRTSYPLRSAGDAHDSISYDGQKWWHTKRVNKITLAENPSGVLAWNTTGYSVLMGSLDTELYAKSNGSAVCDKETIYTVAANKYAYFANMIAAYPTVDDFKAAISSATIVYELATPIVTDITSLMSWDASIAVESGGTVEFVNQQLLDVDNVVDYKVGKSVVSTTQLNTALVTKQDVISDLSTIRAGASAGADALPKNPSNWPTMTDAQKDTACAVVGAERATSWVKLLDETFTEATTSAIIANIEDGSKYSKFLMMLYSPINNAGNTNNNFWLEYTDDTKTMASTTTSNSQETYVYGYIDVSDAIVFTQIRSNSPTYTFNTYGATYNNMKNMINAAMNGVGVKRIYTSGTLPAGASIQFYAK